MDLREICRYLDLDINKIDQYSKDDIKQAYKKIALECHPDKLMSVSDITEKERRVDKFKNATIGYNKLMQDLEKYGKIMKMDCCFTYDFEDLGDDIEAFKDFDISFWQDAFVNMMDKSNDSFLSDTFQGFASFLLKKNLKPYSFYNPSVNIVKHNIVLPVSYYDIWTEKKKKIRLILKGIDEPLFLHIKCSKEYPKFAKQYIDDDGIEHEICVEMKVQSSTHYVHISRDDNSIDLITNVDLQWSEYLLGCTKKILYINKEYIEINVPAFCIDKIVVSGKGLLGGDLVVYLHMVHIKPDKWKNMKENDKNKFLYCLYSLE